MENKQAVTEQEFKSMVTKLQGDVATLRVVTGKLAETSADTDQFNARNEMLCKMVYEGWVPLAVSDKAYRMPFTVAKVIEYMVEVVG